jgi:hypothetical protein
MNEVDIPVWDNPSGDYCHVCRSMGEALGIPRVVHCSDPINCGGMHPMAQGPRQRETHQLVDEV